LLAAYRSMEDPVYGSENRSRHRTQRRHLRLLRRHWQTRSPGRLLDIGCSTGLFLDLASLDGWDVWGVEPAEALASVARTRHGSRVLRSSFEEASLGAMSFEVVSLWDVLEHVHDPPAFVRRVAELLVPGGVLALNVPNLDSLVARLLRSRWPLLLPEHLYYFTPRSLSRLLAEAGFTLEASRAHVAQFSLGYVVDRCKQHSIPGSRVAGWILDRTRMRRLSVPLLMGELTVVARRCHG